MTSPQEHQLKDRNTSVLIVDDDEQVRSLLSAILRDQCECSAVGSAEEALTVLGALSFDVIMSDINLPGMSGLELVPQILAVAPETVVVMISGQQSIESAIEAMRAGAFDYISKPLDIPHVQAAVTRAFTHHELLKQKRWYEDHLEDLVKRRTAEVERLAYYDPLTDFPNRALLIDRLEHAVSKATLEKQSVGLLLVSLDRFKKVNDTLGSAAGDLLLQEVAKKLRCCGPSDATIARIGGDEFAFLLSAMETPESLADLAQCIHKAMRTSFLVGRHELYLNVSIGLSTFPSDGESAEVILKNASAALYRAKKRGGNSHVFYSASMNADAVKQLALEADLRRAVNSKEIVTFYQPVVDLSSGKVAGTEALVRWQHPELGLLLPAHFINLAEDTGLILEIGDQVFAEACRQTKLWQDAGLGSLRIAVNVSALQFSDKQFLARLTRVLAETRIEPQSVELEITETSLMDQAESATSTLSQIRELGVRISIDDFGTGYSSLSYLKRLPIDTVKLDRSFVNGATTDPKDAALVMAIITLAHNLNLNVIAEGIETEEQRSFLRLLRCDEGQGYLFGKPMAANILEATLSTEPHVTTPFPSRTERPAYPRSLVPEVVL